MIITSQNQMTDPDANTRDVILEWSIFRIAFWTSISGKYSILAIVKYPLTAFATLLEI